ncbi:hypothetical protein ACFL9T_09850 [Thermodesulfobacteriota bacterium]
MAFEIISTAISLFSATQGLYRWATGTTVSDRFDEVMNRLRRLENRIFLLEKYELADIKRSQQEYPHDYHELMGQLRRLQQLLDSNLVISQAIAVPGKLADAMSLAPEEFLSYIRPIKTKEDILLSKNDPTLVPITFSRWDQAFIGYTKRGYLNSKFDLRYSPHFLSSPVNSNSEYSSPAIKSYKDIREEGWDRNMGIVVHQKIEHLREATKEMSRVMSPHTGPGSLDLIFGSGGARVDQALERCYDLRQEIADDLERDILDDLNGVFWSTVQNTKDPETMVHALIKEADVFESMLKGKLGHLSLDIPASSSRFICPGCGDSSNAKNGSLCPVCQQFVHHGCASKSFVHWFCPICGAQLVGQ